MNLKGLIPSILNAFAVISGSHEKAFPEFHLLAWLGSPLIPLSGAKPDCCRVDVSLVSLLIAGKQAFSGLSDKLLQPVR